MPNKCLQPVKIALYTNTVVHTLTHLNKLQGVTTTHESRMIEALGIRRRASVNTELNKFAKILCRMHDRDNFETYIRLGSSYNYGLSTL
jgi:hypothetical protein